MRIIHLRYLTRATLVEDLQRAFPRWDGGRDELEDALAERHAHIKIERDPITGTPLAADVYLLVRDDFVLPAWVQGIELTGQRTHTFLGYDTTS